MPRCRKPVKRESKLPTCFLGTYKSQAVGNLSQENSPYGEPFGSGHLVGAMDLEATSGLSSAESIPTAIVCERTDLGHTIDRTATGNLLGIRVEKSTNIGDGKRMCRFGSQDCADDGAATDGSIRIGGVGGIPISGGDGFGDSAGKGGAGWGSAGEGGGRRGGQGTLEATYRRLRLRLDVKVVLCPHSIE